MAVTQYSVRVVKSMVYRGDPAKLWSNRYYFDGGDVGDAAAWHTFFDDLVLIEKAIHLDTVSIVECLGYAPGSDVAVASKSYATAGTLAVSGAVHTPGDCALVLKQATTKRSTKNHPVYVFSYYHRACYLSAGGAPDVPAPAQVTAIANYGNDWLTGIVADGRTYKRTTPDGHPVTSAAVDPYISHRDFPR